MLTKGDFLRGKISFFNLSLSPNCKKKALKKRFFLFKKKKIQAELINDQYFYTLSCSADCQNETYGANSELTRRCCTTDDCNRIEVRPRVTSCYSGGTLVKDKVQTEIDIVKRECLSPQNQFCAVSSFSSSFKTNRFE